MKWPNQHIFLIFIFFSVLSTIFSVLNQEIEYVAMIFGFSIFGIGLFLDIHSTKDHIKYETNLVLVDICKKHGVKKGISIIIVSEILLVVFLLPLTYLEWNFLPSAFFGIFFGSVHMVNYINNKKIVREIMN